MTYKSLLMLCLCVMSVTSTNALTLHVSTHGNDAWSGTLDAPNTDETDGPLATLERARAAVQTIKSTNGLPADGIRVEIQEGTYMLSSPLEFTAADSGTENAPIVYTAKPGGFVRLLGGDLITDINPVRDDAILNRLDEAARPHVLQADLRAMGITDFGSPAGNGIEVFVDGHPLTLSRWPNDDFARIADLVVDDGHAIHGNKGSKVGKFIYDGDRAKRWTQENDLWAHGYWFWDWSDQRQKIESIYTDQSIITIAEPYHNYGYRKGQWYYVYNALAELDTPGEWYLDRESGILYFWPPNPINNCEIVVSIQQNAITMNGVSHVTIQGITVEATRSTAIRMAGGTGNRIVGCTIQNIGANAISISDGSNHGVIGCDITRTGGGGISMTGGDRATLEAAGHFAENNHIHHYARLQRTYQSAIQISGVGIRVSHNLIHDAPHMAIGFGGNDHLIEFNEIHSVSYESNDAGAIYAGRNWTMRGNILRNNFLHHINGFENRGCVGIYLDDMFASAEISNNVFYKVTRAAFIGGGRDCLVENNLFVDCEPALHVDARALNWADYHADEWLEEQKTQGTLSGIAYDKPPYSLRYPALPRILDGEPKAPEGNIIRNNVTWGGTWDGIYKEARPYLTLENNLVDVDPLIEDIEHRNFNLKPDSPALASGFKPIPFDKIGLYEDSARASWPVPHEVR